MKCRYVAVYVAHEIVLPTDVDSVQLYADTTDKVLAILVKDPTALLWDADRGAALAAVVLRGVFGSPDPRDIEAKLAEQVATICHDRKKAASGAPFIVTTIELDAEPDFTAPHTAQSAYSVYLDALDKKQIRASARPIAERIVAAAIVASDGHTRYDRISESVYLVDDAGRVIYSLTFTGNAASLSVRALAPDLPRLITKYATAARRAGAPDLTTVYSLLQAAADGGTEPLRAFISAWSALEIFTNKVFKGYEASWFDELTRGRAATDTRHLSRMRDVMTGKYRLLDKFTVVSSILSPQDSDADVAEFADLKNLRDDLFHGGALNETSLPAHRALNLIRKYLRLHLDNAT